MDNGKVISIKQLKTDKANTTIIIILSICSFVFVFSIIASKTLISQYSYQSRVTKAQQSTLSILNTDKSSAQQLITSFNTFDALNPNIIGGSSNLIQTNQDGTNSKIILDALPTSYDFPATITSFENLLNIPNLNITSLSGSDTIAPPVAAPTTATGTTTATAPATSPAGPIAVPITFTVSGLYSTNISALQSLENSIRPVSITSVDFSGSDTTSNMVVEAQTYYLPSKGFTTSEETIK